MTCIELVCDPLLVLTLNDFELTESMLVVSSITEELLVGKVEDSDCSIKEED